MAKAAIGLGLAAMLGLAGCAAAPAPSSGARPLIAVQAAQPGSFLTLSDVHYDGNGTDIWGQGQETSAILWTRAQAEAKGIVAADDPGFILYLGDLPAHGQPEAARETQFKAVLDGLQGLVAGTNKRLLFLPGNNDSDGEDYCAFTTGGATPFDAASDPTAWPVINAQPGDIIDAAQLARGFYSAYPLGKSAPLRLLALNTVIFNPNYGTFQGASCVDAATRQADANAQIEWLYAQLTDAALKKEKVIVAMHVPPGIDGYGGAPNWDPGRAYTGNAPGLTRYTGRPVQDVYLALVAAFAKQIVGTLSSHTHLGDLRRLRDCDGNVTELDLSIPAVTTDHGSNPAMKLLRYDARYEWLAAETHYASEKTGKNWVADNRFSFADNYPCTACDGSETLGEWIAKVPEQNLLGDMLAYLMVKRSVPSNPRHYQASMDVTCSG
jgi:sphingomyelin phosphodiesterase acid-like 3